MLARALIVLVPLTLVACDREPADASSQSKAAEQPASEPVNPHDKVQKVTVDQLSTWLASGAAVPVDANSGDTRVKVGVIPKSVLLSKSSGYDRAELPADKGTKLVFYCYNKSCSAAPNAAEYAMEAGYKDVSVLPDGITGWVSAGKPVSKPNS